MTVLYQDWKGFVYQVAADKHGLGADLRRIQTLDGVGRTRGRVGRQEGEWVGQEGLVCELAWTPPPRDCDWPRKERGWTVIGLVKR